MTSQLISINDLFHYWGGDLSVSITGDLQAVAGTIRGQQRVLRRLLTNPGDYIFHPKYGGGLPQYVGLPLNIPKITAVIRTQLTLEAVVSRSPLPQISVSQSASDYTAFTVSINYVDAVTAKPIVLAFSVSS